MLPLSLEAGPGPILVKIRSQLPARRPIARREDQVFSDGMKKSLDSKAGS